MAGTLIISLDFELFWGVRDVTTVEAYGSQLRGVREAIPAMLTLFDAFGIRATWATVGFLFFDSKAALLEAMPENRPHYIEPKLSPYIGIDRIGDNESTDPYHFGGALVDMIRKSEGQELGTHTFSHYYALERGQTGDAFRADLLAACRVALSRGVTLRSLVFPRNQYNPQYIDICRTAGITSYRGNESSWIYEASAGAKASPTKRGARLVDAYLNMSGHHTYALHDVARGGPPYNLAASRFLRPWSPTLRRLEQWRLRRIERAMTYAARHDEVFHLWWHPHNFGVNLTNNMNNLHRILSHFDDLRRRYHMHSRSMGDVASSLVNPPATGLSS